MSDGTALARFAAGSPAAAGVATVRELVVLWLAGRAPSTVLAHQQDLEAFGRFLGVGAVEDLVETFLGRGPAVANAIGLAWRGELLERGVAPAAVNRRLAAVRSLVKLGRHLGLVSFELEVGGVRSETLRDTSGPGVDGMRRLLARARWQEGAKAARDVAVLRLCFDLGLRRGEVTRLDVDDVDLAAARVWVVRKGKRERVPLSLPERTQEALREWLRWRPDGAERALFVSLGRRGGRGRLRGDELYVVVRSLGRKAGVRVSPHRIRHSAIAAALEVVAAGGGSIEETLSFSGHAPGSVGILLRYCDNPNDRQGEIAAAVARRV